MYIRQLFSDIQCGYLELQYYPVLGQIYASSIEYPTRDVTSDIRPDTGYKKGRDNLAGYPGHRVTMSQTNNTGQTPGKIIIMIIFVTIGVYYIFGMA